MPKRLLKHFSRREKQTTFVAIGALRVGEIIKREVNDPEWNYLVAVYKIIYFIVLLRARRPKMNVLSTGIDISDYSLKSLRVV